MSLYTYFTDEEVRGLDATFVQKLDKARGLAGVPFIITSGLRTFEENQSIPGAVSDSSHLFGLGVDLKCDLSFTRFVMVKALLDAGFVRIGIYKAHIHADDSKTLPPNVMWYSENA